MKKSFVFLLPLGLASLGCQDSGDKNQIQELQDSVMVVHDAVMPKQETIYDLKEKISKQIDSLSKITPITANLKNRQEEGFTINKNLMEADSLMDEWMTHYNSDTLKVLDEPQAKAYLDQELKKITEVKEKINGGIDQAKKFLGN